MIGYNFLLMIREEQRFWRRLNNIADGMITLGTFGLSYQLRINLATIPGLSDLGGLAPFEYYAFVMLFAAIVWPILLNHHGLYSTTRFNRRLANFIIILRSSAEALLFMIAFIYIFQIGAVSRILLLIFAIANCIILIIKDNIIHFYYKGRRLKGLDIKKILIVGTSKLVSRMIPKLEEQVEMGLSPVGIVLIDDEEDKKIMNDIPVLGKIQNFREIIHENSVNQVVFTTPRERHHEIDNAFMTCVDEGIEAWILVDYFDRYLVQAKVDTISGMPILAYHNAPILTWQYILKSILDRFVALFLLILFSPLFLIISLGILFSYGTPVFFRQERAGRFGNPFTLYKFRSIEGSHSKWLGRWLRKTGLDELPQLINILKGEMSFVGPRPHVLQEVSQYKDHRQRRRLSVKPGLTGSRQISRPEKISFDEQLDLDLEYIDQWSLFKDIIIMVKTVPSVLGRFFGRHSGEVH